MISKYDLVVFTEDEARLIPHGLPGYGGRWGYVTGDPFERTFSVTRGGERRLIEGKAIRVRAQGKHGGFNEVWTWIQTIRPAPTVWTGCACPILKPHGSLGAEYRLYECTDCHRLHRKTLVPIRYGWSTSGTTGSGSYIRWTKSS